VKALYPPFGDPGDLPRDVLVFAPHPDDEVFGCGGMLAWHARHGAKVRVVIVSDGTGGDPAARTEDIIATRIAEARAGAEVLGLGLDADYRFLGLPDGRLGEQGDLVEQLASELEDFDPELVYGPSVQELHPDHRALAQGHFAGTGGRNLDILPLHGFGTAISINTDRVRHGLTFPFVRLGTAIRQDRPAPQACSGRDHELAGWTAGAERDHA